MSICTKALPEGYPRLEFKDCAAGMSRWICLNCGEIELQAEDCGSGG